MLRDYPGSQGLPCLLVNLAVTFFLHFPESLGVCSVPVQVVRDIVQTQAAKLKVNCKQGREEEESLAQARGTPSVLARSSSNSYSDLR